MKTLRISILLLAFMPGLTWADEIGKARVITSFNEAVKCISPIHIRNIDGREIGVPRLGFTLEPGRHTLTGTALLGSTRCLTIGSGTRHYHAEPLDALFEAGKIYYVGYDHSSPDRDDWKVVIWKIADEKS